MQTTRQLRPACTHLRQATCVVSVTVCQEVALALRALQQATVSQCAQRACTSSSQLLTDLEAEAVDDEASSWNPLNLLYL